MHVLAKVSSIGTSTGNANTEVDLIIDWSAGVIGGIYWAGQDVVKMDTANGIVAGSKAARASLAALVSAQIGVTVTADQVGDIAEWLSSGSSLVPITVTFSSLLAADDLARVIVPSPPGVTSIKLDAHDWSVSARVLLAGTATLVVKNAAGTTLASRAITGAEGFSFTPAVSSINPGDVLRFGFTGLGVGLQDVCVTAWLKLPMVY